MLHIHESAVFKFTYALLVDLGLSNKCKMNEFLLGKILVG